MTKCYIANLGHRLSCFAILDPARGGIIGSELGLQLCDLFLEFVTEVRLEKIGVARAVRTPGVDEEHAFELDPCGGAIH